jgi:ABC-2 type transport system permease protein
MTVLTRRASAGHYLFRHVARMEWIKLRSLRSTWWTLAITAAGAVAMAVVIGVNTMSKSADLTNNVLAGVVPGLLLIGVLGVLTVTSEYT